MRYVIIVLLLFLVSCSQVEEPEEIILDIQPLEDEVDLESSVPEPVPEEEYEIEEIEEPVVDEGPKEYIVFIENFKYNPKTITINVGDTVTWINQDIRAYKINEKRKRVLGDRLAPGEEWSFTFTEPGIYDIFDSIKPAIQGTVVVVEDDPVPTGYFLGGVPDPSSAATILALSLIALSVMLFYRVTHVKEKKKIKKKRRK